MALLDFLFLVQGQGCAIRFTIFSPKVYLRQTVNLHRKRKNKKIKNIVILKNHFGRCLCFWKCKIVFLFGDSQFDVFIMFFSNFLKKTIFFLQKIKNLLKMCAVVPGMAINLGKYPIKVETMSQRF